MREGQEQRSTQMPWPLRIRPLTITAGVATTALVLLAVLVPSDVTRVALPAIAGAVGTIGLAVVTVRLSISERAHQDQLRRAEAEHQQAIKAAEERAANQRESELKLADAVRQARRVAAFPGSQDPTTADGYASTVTLVNGSDYPIFEIALIGARNEVMGEPYVKGGKVYLRSVDKTVLPVSHTDWPPEMRLRGESLHVAVLLPGERHVFRGTWKWKKGYVKRGGNTFSELRITYTWTDDQGRAWQRDGSKPPDLRERAWVWAEIWGDADYLDEPVIEP